MEPTQLALLDGLPKWTPAHINKNYQLKPAREVRQQEHKHADWQLQQHVVLLWAVTSRWRILVNMTRYMAINTS
jgi:hypothetical protein